MQQHIIYCLIVHSCSRDEVTSWLCGPYFGLNGLFLSARQIRFTQTVTVLSLVQQLPVASTTVNLFDHQAAETCSVCSLLVLNHSPSSSSHSSSSSSLFLIPSKMGQTAAAAAAGERSRKRDRLWKCLAKVHVVTLLPPLFIFLCYEICFIPQLQLFGVDHKVCHLLKINRRDTMMYYGT